MTGIYDAANTFTSADQTLNTSNAVLLGAPVTDAGTVATDSVLLMGYNRVTSL